MLGGAGGGLTCFLYDGYLCYEYNLFILTRTKIRSATPLTSGRRIVEVTTQYAEPRPGGPLTITVSVDREPVAEGVVPVIAPPLFTANDCLDVGTCLGSPVSLDNYDKAPYPFTGHFDTMRVEYT